jgi:hypothetical protein
VNKVEKLEIIIIPLFTFIMDELDCIEEAAIEPIVYHDGWIATKADYSQDNASE